MEIDNKPLDSICLNSIFYNCICICLRQSFLIFFIERVMRKKENVLFFDKNEIFFRWQQRVENV